VNMPQARLPDINTAFTKFTNKALSSLESENFSSCIGSAYALNALLPDEYRVRVSTQSYNEATKKHTVAVCQYCNDEVETKTLEYNDQVKSSFEQILTSTQTEKVWLCKKCNKAQLRLMTLYKEVIPAEPYFVNCVPKPPERKDGLMSRSSYKREFTTWFWLFMGELEERMAQFRDDNWTKTEQFGDEQTTEGGESDDE